MDNTATEVFQKVVDTAIQNKSERVRHYTNETIPMGKWHRQGDIYIHRVEPSHAHGPRTENYKLAVGTSRGAQHVAMFMHSEDSVKVYHGTTLPSYANPATTFMGPFVESSEEFKIYHPEHAHVILPAGCYQITHQRNMHQNARQKD